MKFSTAIVFALIVPALALSPSYLDNIAQPATASSAATYYFTDDGAVDEPVSSAGASSKNTADYMSALTGSGAKAPTGAGMHSYLDALKGPGAVAAPRGAGMTSYLDALKSSSTAPTGVGLSSYAASLNEAGAVTPVVPAAAAKAEPTSFESATSTVATTAASYLGNLQSSSSTAPTGAGIMGYLDALPQGAGAPTGAGIPSYANALKTVNVVSGAGLSSYSDALSPTSSSWKGASSASIQSPNAFTIGSVSGKFDFSFEASAELIAKLKEAGNRRVTLTGKVTDISF